MHTRKRLPSRVALVAVTGLTVAMTAACTGDAVDKPGPASAAALPPGSASPTSVPESAAPDGLADADAGAPSPNAERQHPADDAALRDLISSFSPSIDGFAFADQPGAPDYATAFDLWNGANVEITPGSCKPVEAAMELATDADLTDAARDLLQPNGLYLEPSEIPYNGEEIEGPSIHVLTRIFGDELGAAALATNAVAADCDTYSVAYGDVGFGYSRGQVTVGMRELPSVAQPVVRLEVNDDVTWREDSNGKVDTGEPVDAVGYLHVAGPFAIRVMMTDVEDPEGVASRVIADFVAHMSPQ